MRFLILGADGERCGIPLGLIAEKLLGVILRKWAGFALRANPVLGGER